MQDFIGCVRHKGKIYCWDKRNETFVEIELTDVPIENVPKEVYSALFNMIGKQEG
ncbi:MAG: hypothetical protein FWH12_02470 [Treponema sp.]|nr:hypothetical protein [Treponema sp.]